jgi:hypothetical protein
MHADPTFAALLPKDRYQAARGFMETSTRPLDQALLLHALGEAGAEPAFLALSEFQNPDGGFGGGLEPDSQGPASTALATSVALRQLQRLGATARHPMVVAAIGWLDETLDPERSVWWIVGPGHGHAPHAPWMRWSEDAIGGDTLAGAEQGFRFNPTAELLGQLYEWREAAPTELVETVEARFRETIAATRLIESAYDLKCAARLAETPSAPADLRSDLDALVRRSIEAHDPADVHLSPLELAPTPQSLFADAVAVRAGPAIDALIASQQPDGGWPLFWDWGFVDKVAWARAKRDARSSITREALETLHAYDRIEA